MERGATDEKPSSGGPVTCSSAGRLLRPHRTSRPDILALNVSDYGSTRTGAAHCANLARDCAAQLGLLKATLVSTAARARPNIALFLFALYSVRGREVLCKFGGAVEREGKSAANLVELQCSIPSFRPGRIGPAVNAPGECVCPSRGSLGRFPSLSSSGSSSHLRLACAFRSGFVLARRLRAPGGSSSLFRGRLLAERRIISDASDFAPLNIIIARDSQSVAAVRFSSAG